MPNIKKFRPSCFILSTLQYAKISDTVWGLHMLTMSKAYAQSVHYTVKTMVSNVGRQPNSNVWVFSDSLQIDHMGQIIRTDFLLVSLFSMCIIIILSTCRHTSSISKTPLTPAPICLPLQLSSLTRLFELTGVPWCQLRNHSLCLIF